MPSRGNGRKVTGGGSAFLKLLLERLSADYDCRRADFWRDMVYNELDLLWKIESNYRPKVMDAHEC
jgi:hypothetical protein